MTPISPEAILALSSISKSSTIKSLRKLLCTHDFDDNILYSEFRKHKKNEDGYKLKYDEQKEKYSTIIKKSDREGIITITFFDDHYPERLRAIPDPPGVLFINGNVELLKNRGIAVVGTRKPTDMGLRFSEDLSSLLVKEEYSIISGLAEGIDTAAHQAAIKNNGKTIAILGHGLDSIYPKTNKKLADDIIKCDGTLVSEYPYGFPIKKYQLVERDRIQSGLSQAVFVVETDVNGGTMHTVKAAKKQGRTIIVQEPAEKFKDYPQYGGNKKLIMESSTDSSVIPCKNIEHTMDIIKNNLQKKLVFQSTLL